MLGPSGSGKTTLLRAVAGLQPLDGGRICWDGDDLAAVAAARAPLRAHVPGVRAVPAPRRRRQRRVRAAHDARHAATERGPTRVDEVLELVGLAGLRRRAASRRCRAGSSSGSRSPRALAVSPRLLMLDEPLGALDRVWRRRLLGEIRDDPRSVAPRRALRDARSRRGVLDRVTRSRSCATDAIVQVGAPADVWRAPADAWTATFLGFGPVVDGEVRDGLVHTPWGPIAGAGPRAGAARSTWSCRPDGARLDPEGPIDATVVQSTFTGTHVELTAVAGGSGPALTIVVPPAARAGRGRPSAGVDRPRRRARLSPSGRLTGWRPGPRSKQGARAARVAIRC